jgi:hypothetical protein
MIKVFEDFDYMRVGQMQSILEANDIQTFLKNQFGFGGTGELPFVETVPQLFVLQEEDEERARQLIGDAARDVTEAEAWECKKCGPRPGNARNAVQRSGAVSPNAGTAPKTKTRKSSPALRL